MNLIFVRTWWDRQSHGLSEGSQNELAADWYSIYQPGDDINHDSYFIEDMCLNSSEVQK
jgi:hypothetical protein